MSGACRVVVDMGKCSGLGICEAEAPDFFEIGADGQLMVLSYEVSAERRAEVEVAARACPTQAIVVEEVGGDA
ncbi:ferredoxin [Rhodococcus sp. 15-2388-1-1a]|jgi:ferredoxin|uniref:ferredoxin n=1 Tax=Nocardiaceae TaxID=85025 RepID=UPI000565455D|nr:MULTISPECIES: ferredoxin [Rhodococcus]OZE93088.1 ferredoxin [Rhodococcus sp. 15-2388-1-1a]OZF34266.1 ferredoxin [Rhodococcus sp. 14-2483-1-2]